MYSRPNDKKNYNLVKHFYINLVSELIFAKEGAAEKLISYVKATPIVTMSKFKLRGFPRIPYKTC